MLSLAAVSAGYGSFKALFGVSLEVSRGEAVGVIGPNGAGKTTLMRAISGLIPLSEGAMTLEGRAVLARALRLDRHRPYTLQAEIAARHVEEPPDWTRIAALYGELVRLTRDHTLVQSLVDEGRITEQEAATHPRRSWLMRTLQDGSAAEPDLFVHTAVVGDRYLICSDGLTAVLDDEMVGEVLRSESDRDAAVARFLRLANAGGGPDNITCIVADFADAPATDGETVVVGAAASKREPA